MIKGVIVTKATLSSIEADIQEFLFNEQELIEGYSNNSAAGPFEPTGCEKNAVELMEPCGLIRKGVGHNYTGFTVNGGDIRIRVALGDVVWSADDYIIVRHTDSKPPRRNSPFEQTTYRLIHKGLDASVLNSKFDIELD